MGGSTIESGAKEATVTGGCQGPPKGRFAETMVLLASFAQTAVVLPAAFMVMSSRAFCVPVDMVTAGVQELASKALVKLVNSSRIREKELSDFKIFMSACERDFG